ncbi:MAG TPA: hypothetical protein VFI31_03610 [Pirellulales bacterium]|nr:hypothetical protein [Pirellulales bacterium]
MNASNLRRPYRAQTPSCPSAKHVFIFLTLAESTLSLKLYNGDEAGRRRSRRLDHCSFFVLPAAYAGLSAAAVAWY